MESSFETRSRSATADSGLEDSAIGSHIVDSQQQQQQQQQDGESATGQPGSEVTGEVTASGDTWDDEQLQQQPPPKAAPPTEEELAAYADSVEQLWDVLEGYGLVKPEGGTRPIPLEMPAEEPDAGIYAEGFSAENFVAPPEVEDPNQNLTDAFSLLEDLPQVLESLDDQVPAAIHELCDQLYHRTQWHKAHPVLDKLAGFPQEPLAQAVLFEANDKGAYLYQRNVKAATAHLRAIDLDQLALHAERGNAHAQYHLGCMLHGEGELGDALFWFECAANKAHPPAQFRLSQCYGHGHGVTASAETSFYWCKLSAQQGYAPALNDVGIKVEVYGEGVDAFRSAAAQHYPAAYFNLALCSHFGRGVPASYDTAIRLYRQAAEAGSVSAKFNLAMSYFLGQGVGRSEATAVQGFRSGAGLGHTESQNNLGYCQYFGKGVPRDFDKAAECFRLAAAQGDFMAMYNLSCCYERGSGMVKNEAAAAYLRAEAAKARESGRIREAGQKHSRVLGTKSVAMEPQLQARRIDPNGSVSSSSSSSSSSSRGAASPLPSLSRGDGGDINRPPNDIDNGAMITSIESTPVIGQRILYLQRGVTVFEASPAMADRSNVDEQSIRGVSLFSASNARTLRTVGARTPAKARAEQAQAPENFLAVYSDDDDTSTEADDRSFLTSSTWASRDINGEINGVGGMNGGKRIALSPIKKEDGGGGGGGLFDDNSANADLDGGGDDNSDDGGDLIETVAHDNYFGSKARVRFYQSFRQMSRLKNHYTPQELGDMRQKQVLTKPKSGQPQQINASAADMFPPSNSRAESMESEETTSEGGFIVDGKKAPKQLELPALKGIAAKHVERLQEKMARVQRERDKASGKEYNLTRTLPELQVRRLKETLTEDRHLSPRSTFLQDLLFCAGGPGGDDTRDMVKLPRSILVVRRDSSLREISLAHQGVGDDLGKALASCLKRLPQIESLNICDNNLHDESLGPILDAASQIPNLTKLDVGINKLDREASAALAALLSRYNCPLKELRMSGADVDDEECGDLMKRLVENKSVEVLDLSHNLIGAKEAMNIVMPEFDTGPEMIGEFLKDERCMLVVLNLAWNSIQKDSARQLGEALGDNKTLHEIDLSYNAFGDMGGQAIGDMLHRNTGLVKIDLSNNNINHRAAFTIACGLRHNATLCELNLRGNPIGDIGGRSLMQVPIDIGEHITVHLEKCSMTLEDRTFQIDKDTHLPKEPMDEPKKPEKEGEKMKISYKCDLSVPYRRAIAFEVLRIAAERPGYVVEKAVLNGTEVQLERSTLERDLKDDQLIKQIDEAEKHIDEFWERYDIDGSQTIDEIELAELLRDLKMPVSVGNVTRIMKVYDVDNSGLLEKVEILEFLEQAKKDVRERTKPRTVMAEPGRTLPFELPPGYGDDGAGGQSIFEITLGINPEREEVVRTTSSVEIEKIMSVARKADNRLLALQLSLGHLRLQVEEARELIKEIRQEVVNPIEVLSMVIPYMSNAQHSQLLVTLELKDNAMRDLNLEGEGAMEAEFLKARDKAAKAKRDAEITKEMDAVKAAKDNTKAAKGGKDKGGKDKGATKGSAEEREAPARRGSKEAEPLVMETEEEFEREFEKFRQEKMDQVDKTIANGRRELEGKLSPAFKPLMGMYTGHYTLDLSKDVDRLCMTKLGEQNNLEGKMNRFRLGRMDTSQKGNWFCYRNEKLNGVQFQIRSDFFDPLPSSGRVDFDFVSTVRPSAQISKIRPQRFTTLFRKLRWIKNDAEADIVLQELEKPYGAVRRMDDTELTAFDQEIGLLREDDDSLSYRADTVGPQKQELKRQTTLVGGEAQALLALSGGGGDGGASGSEGGDGAPGLPVGCPGGGPGGVSSPGGRGGKGSRRARGTVKSVVRTIDAREALAQLRDKLSTKWFDCRQAQWMVLNTPVSLYKNPPKDWKVDLVVDLHSRIVDLVYFDVVLETLRPRERAKVVHRLGWLNTFSPSRPDHFFALDLRHREDRIVVKMLVHMGAVEPGVNWLKATYRAARAIDDVPGWELTTMWFKEESLPARGNLRVEYYSGEGKGLKNCRPDDFLRALLQEVVLADELPEDQELLFRGTNGGTLSREGLIVKSLKSQAEPPILWIYDNRNPSFSRP